jgi:2,4-diketo-3-deoxy-L-fuconate hydrolase
VHYAGPEDDLVLPKESNQVDWEVELGVVIGKGGRYDGGRGCVANLRASRISNEGMI